MAVLLLYTLQLAVNTVKAVSPHPHPHPVRVYVSVSLLAGALLSSLASRVGRVVTGLGSSCIQHQIQGNSVYLPFFTVCLMPEEAPMTRIVRSYRAVIPPPLGGG